MALLSKEVVILVGIAIPIACPLAYYVMFRWLQNFAFRISLHPVYFLASILITIGIAFLSISYRTLKAAHGNPASALKYE